MRGWERPSEKGDPQTVVDYWAQIDCADGTEHGATLTSPTFTDEKDMRAWIKANLGRALDEDSVHPWRRERAKSGAVRDVSLTESEDFRRDPARVAQLLAGARSKLADTSRLNAIRPSPSERERGAAARERLDKAGREAKAQEAV